MPAARIVACVSAVLALASVLASCNEPPVAPTPILGSQPLAESAPSPAPVLLPAEVATPPITLPSLPVPSPNPEVGLTLSGVVYDGSAQVLRPIRGGTIDYSLNPSPSGANTRGEVGFGADGRYVISNLPHGSSVKITAFSRGNDGWRAQQCAAKGTMLADTALDIELVFPEVRGTAPEPPALSGVVFEKTTQGRRPVAGTPVVYYTVYEGTYDVYTHTDSNGRYEFCRIPLGTGLLMAGDCNDSMMPMPVDIRGDTVVDIDLTSFMASCRMVR